LGPAEPPATEGLAPATAVLTKINKRELKRIVAADFMAGY
jgi:hypothetical protein